MKKKLITIVIPVHNEATNIAWFYDQLRGQLDKLTDYDFTCLFIDDGSTDTSLDSIKSLRPKVEYISFSRNFGKEAATSAGLQAARGDAVILIDADGQHPAGLIPEFLEQWQNGHEVVIGVRKANTKEGMVKRYGSKAFYRLLNSFTGGNTVSGSTDFRLIDRRVIDEFNRLTERSRITRGLIDWLGFKRTFVPFVAPARHSGQATYGFRKLAKLALHAFVSQTTRPLQLTGFLGAFVMLASALTAIFLLVEKYAFGDPWHLAVTGSAILALFLSFLVGLVLICQWLLALYVESIHNETQNRPLYIIRDRSE